MYVDTKELDKVLIELMPNTHKEERAIFIVKRLDLRNIAENRYKFMLDRMILLDNKTSIKLFKYLTELKQNGMNIDIDKIILCTKKKNVKILTRREVTYERSRIENEIAHAQENILNSTNKKNIEKNDEDAKTIVKNTEDQIKLFTELIDQLEKVNKNLIGIAQTQNETCNFIRTLVFALNGNPKDAA